MATFCLNKVKGGFEYQTVTTNADLAFLAIQKLLENNQTLF